MKYKIVSVCGCAVIVAAVCLSGCRIQGNMSEVEPAARAHGSGIKAADTAQAEIPRITPRPIFEASPIPTEGGAPVSFIDTRPEAPTTEPASATPPPVPEATETEATVSEATATPAIVNTPAPAAPAIRTLPTPVPVLVQVNTDPDQFIDPLGTPIPVLPTPAPTQAPVITVIPAATPEPTPIPTSDPQPAEPPKLPGFAYCSCGAVLSESEYVGHMKQHALNGDIFHYDTY